MMENKKKRKNSVNKPHKQGKKWGRPHFFQKMAIFLKKGVDK